jgi:hypothetical protein
VKTANNAGKSNLLTIAIALAALLAALPAVAQVSDNSGSTSNLPTFVREHGPMRLHAVHPGVGVDSENWSGYAVTGTGFTSASGSWHVPEVQCNKTPNASSGFWVGLDGFQQGNDTIEQNGTASDCSGTTPVYYAWYEYYPAGAVKIKNVPVTAGDIISAEVSYNGSEFTLTLTNETTGKTHSHTKALAGAQRTSAEWIAEAPCCTSGGGILPLANFDKANFGFDNTGINNTNFATDSSVINEPIFDFGATNVFAITMVSDTGVTEAVPTSLTSDGTSFTVSWESE